MTFIGSQSENPSGFLHVADLHRFTQQCDRHLNTGIDHVSDHEREYGKNAWVSQRFCVHVWCRGNHREISTIFAPTHLGGDAGYTIWQE